MPNPVGRPSAYREEFCEQARKLCLLGATDEELADFFSVTHTTLNTWKETYPDFVASIHAGKDQADAEVADKLFHRARGYSHPAVKIFMPQGADEPVYAPYTEHYPPDTQAASLWLRNRQPRRWRDKTEKELTGKDGGPIQVDAVDRRQQAKALLDESFVEHVAVELDASKPGD